MLAGSAAAQKYTLDEFSRQRLDDQFYAEGAAIGDIDGDGKADIIAGPFWFAGPDFNHRHEIYPPKAFDRKGYSDNFLSFTRDIDSDGRIDVMVLGFPGKQARWYQNPGKEALDKQHWPVHVALNGVDNESPMFTDVTGDGEPEIVCMHDGKVGYASPGDDPTRPWRFVAVSPKGPYQRFTHGLGVGDIDGDGRADILEKTGWWQQPANWDGQSPWTRHDCQFTGAGGAQMLVFDVDGDGDNDVVTALNAHGYGLAWFQQTRDGDRITFKQHDIITASPSDNRFGVAFSQLHALAAIDLDGDGLTDIVTGKRWWAHNGHDPGTADPAVVYGFTLKRHKEGVEFVPQPIDNDSGVGTQVTFGDVDGDGLPDIVVANKKGIFVHRHARRTVSQGEWFWANHPAMKAVGKTPQQTAAGMTLPKGFAASPAVGEPDVHQPIAFTIDARGRLWVAENDSYPDWAPTGHDRLMIYEDADGDGYFEKSTLFYDKLNFVSGVEVGFGGVLVGSAPNLLFIPDRDHDDKPDGEPEVLLDGFGHQDTHETLNSFIWGPDGWLYGCHGVFTHSRVGRPGTPDEQRVPLNAGVWRYHPITHRFEVFAEGTSNPWGVDFDDRGQCFITACVIPHGYHLTPGGRYQRQAGRHFEPYTYDDIKTIADHSHFAGSMREFGTDAMDRAGGGHAHAGAMIYLGDNWPADYRGKLFMNNIHGNRINMDVLTPNGSTFTASHGDDFMLANDKWYRGLYLRYGPDGGVFVSDWYDPRACHQQRPHDRTNGRIYKITYGQVAPLKVDLEAMTDDELVKMQLHANDWYVRTARRILMQRFAAGKLGGQTRAALMKRLGEQKDTGRRLRIVWALHVTGGLDEALTLRLLEDGDEYVRAWAVGLMAEDGAASPSELQKLAAMAQDDPSVVVRRYLASAMGRLPGDQRWDIAAGLLAHGEDAQDADIPLLCWYGVEPLVAADAGRAIGLIDGCKLPIVSRYIVRRAASEPESMGPLVQRLGKKMNQATQKWMLAEMRLALADRPHAAMPEGWETVYTHLGASDDDQIRDDAQFLAMRFGDQRVFPQLRKIVADDKAPIAQRRAAMDILIAGADVEAMAPFASVLDEPALRHKALQGLAVAEYAEAPAAILKHYDQYTPEQKQAAVATLSARPTYAEAMMRAVGAGKVARAEVPLFAVRQMLAFKTQSLDALIDKNWGKIRELSADTRQQIDQWKQTLNPAYMKTADVHHGRVMYNNLCAACHTLFGAGGAIGPDLTGSNRADLGYLLENVVDPNATIGRDYQLVVIAMKDGRAVSGMIRGENDSGLTLQTATERVVVPRDQIASQQVMPMSMMPQGLLATMQDSDVRDLVAYLASPHQVTLPGATPGGIPGAAPIEGESLKVVKVTRGTVRPQAMGGFAADRWSGDAHLWWTGAQPGEALTLALPVDKSGRYEIIVAMTRAHDYGIVQLLIDGRPVGEPIDLFNARAEGRSDVINTGPISLGAHDLKPDSTLGVRIVGANEHAAKAYMFAIDYLRLSPAQ